MVKADVEACGSSLFPTRRSRAAPAATAPTTGGVDANASKEHLLDLARRLDVPGRSSMTKDELVEALQRANDAETRRSRG